MHNATDEHGLTLEDHQDIAKRCPAHHGGTFGHLASNGRHYRINSATGKPVPSETDLLLQEIRALRHTLLTCEPDHSHVPFPAYANDGPKP